MSTDQPQFIFKEPFKHFPQVGTVAQAKYCTARNCSVFYPVSLVFWHLTLIQGVGGSKPKRTLS